MKLKHLLPHIAFFARPVMIVLAAGISLAFISARIIDTQHSLEKKLLASQNARSKLETESSKLRKDLDSVSGDLATLKKEDQYVKNTELEGNIKQIEATYKESVTVYEKLLDLKTQMKDTKKYDASFADILALLSKRNYASASAELSDLKTGIQTEFDKIAASFVIPTNVPQNNAPPSSGGNKQSVSSDVGTFLVDMVAGDLSSTRVIVDTASGGDCKNDCPVLPLGDYVARNGAYAGVNGAYFCPATYPSCAGKTNSFDTLLMNKNKVYFNSDNNVYSTVPAVIFGNGWVRFVGRSLEWGRDTSPDSVIANYPLLLMGGNIQFNGNGDPKIDTKGNRAFVANRGNTVYIGVVYNATVTEVAHVLKALGMENAINLDSGGSLALWYNGGYRAGPGRNLPDAILFVRK